VAKKLTVIVSLFMLVATMGARAAEASTIVNLDGLVNDFGSDPKLVFLTPGTYTITPIGVADGGAYDSWSAWSANSGCDVNGENCTQGFMNSYIWSAGDIGTASFFNGGIYATPLQALSHGIASSFTITTPEFVQFGLNDCSGCMSDNRGGESLLVEAQESAPVPEPASMTLIGTGLAGVFARRLRKKQAA
jgi:PEP-CTERM motif